jgi:hypothetical protein
LHLDLDFGAAALADPFEACLLYYRVFPRLRSRSSVSTHTRAPLSARTQYFDATGFTCSHVCGNPGIRVASFQLGRRRAYPNLSHCLPRCFRKCRANPGGSRLNVQPASAAGFLFFSRPVRAERETTEARVSTLSLLALCFNTAWRDRECAMPGLILSSPQPAAVADMHKATTYEGDHSGHEHSQVCEAQLAYPSRRPGRLHRPRAEIEGAWCTSTGTSGKPINTCAVLKYFVGEAPPS